VKSIARIFLILILLLPGIIACAQNNSEQNYVLLHGIIMDGETELPLGNVHYIIKNLSITGATGNDGKFSIYMERTDTIIFSHLGYIDLFFSLHDTLVGNKFVAGIFMQLDIFAIGEVVVMPRMADLRTEFRSGSNQVSQDLVNARNNITISTYQGLNNQSSLGDPETNYQLLKRKQIVNAYEKGGIPSDMMVGLNFITFLPATLYLITSGLPERPDPPKPYISQEEMERIKDIYKQNLKREKK